MNLIRIVLFVLILAVVVLQPAEANSASNHFVCPGSRRALVLGGGGVRGAYQVGALWYLVDVLGCDFDHFIGTSTGAITAISLAQAANQEGLRRQVAFLMEQYGRLESRSDLVSERFLGLPRLILPRWLGGVDGLATLEPVEQRLRASLKARGVRYDKLTVTAVSLQAGALDPTVYSVDDLIDLAIGSASIPLAIEPRRARVWVRARPEELNADILTVSVDGVPGLPDPKCELRLTAWTTVECEQLDTSVTTTARKNSTDLNFGPSFEVGAVVVRALTRLKIRNLTTRDAELIASAVGAQHATGVVPDPPFQFTAVHQLIDGGVIENVPLRHAIRLVGKERGIDTIFVLLSGSPPVGAYQTEVESGRRILETSFDLLWGAYQNAAFRAPYGSLFEAKVVCGWYVQQMKVREWRRTIGEAVGEKRLAEIEQRTGQRFPVEGSNFFDPVKWISEECTTGSWDRWNLWTIDPPLPQLGGPLSVEPRKIRAAFRDGCVAAASVVYDRLTLQAQGSVSSDQTDAYAKAVCQPLISR